MLEENKNLKDTSSKLIRPIDGSIPMVPSLGGHFSSYTKTNKLITALYIVTDTMEKDEPIRVRLRTLGVDLLSDMASLPKGTSKRVDENISIILSFLNIAFDIGMISEMNSNILKKEFAELKQSIQEYTKQNNFYFEELMNSTSPDKGRQEGLYSSRTQTMSLSKKEFSKGHGTRIGVQKGSTLMSALNKVEGISGFEILKKERRESIIKIIKDKPEGMSIKDISFTLKNLGKEIGDKTLQRELVSMVSDSTLKKAGDKRWSKYFV